MRLATLHSIGHVDHGGPVIIMLATGSEVQGFKPVRGRWIFSERKNPSMTSFGREVKPWVRIIDLRHVKELKAEIRASDQNLSDFSRSIIESDANYLRC